MSTVPTPTRAFVFDLVRLAVRLPLSKSLRRRPTFVFTGTKSSQAELFMRRSTKEGAHRIAQRAILRPRHLARAQQLVMNSTAAAAV